MRPLLHHEPVTGRGKAEKWLLILHNIFGCGRNWLPIARKVVDCRPDWGIVLLDLPGHSHSQRVTADTLDEAADAVHRLVEELAIPVAGVLGHALGGKVALCYAEAAVGLEQAWIADGCPGPTGPVGDDHRAADAIRRLQKTFPTRDDIVRALVELGASPSVAKCIAMDLAKRSDKDGQWQLRSAQLGRLLRDFYAVDLWEVVECDTDGLRLEFIKAEASSVLSEPVCRRIEEAGAHNPHVRLHRLPCSHRMNIDKPDILVKLLAERLVR